MAEAGILPYITVVILFVSLGILLWFFQRRPPTRSKEEEEKLPVSKIFSIISIPILLIFISTIFGINPRETIFFGIDPNKIMFFLSSIGLILEITGFMVFILIEKKAEFSGGIFDGGDIKINGKPMGKDDAIIVRNQRHGKKSNLFGSNWFVVAINWAMG